MLINNIRRREYLQAGDLKMLFIEEMGWDRLRTSLPVTAGGEDFTLSPVAEKRGVQIYQCSPMADGKIPEYTVRRKIEAEVTKSAFQHVIIFMDAKKTTQVWQWASREAGKALSTREQVYQNGQSGDLLLQKLGRISFDISEEEGLTLTGVEYKLKQGFDKEGITRNFYEQFKDEHKAFLGFVKNIPDADLQRWYASVMINRLMFLYFIQDKRFLASDPNYLDTKLNESQGHYYRDFLCPLFFEGFAKREGERAPAITALLGKVPYLNGGLFTKHQIEEQYGQSIAIADEAFAKLFKFFGEWDWHLDDRPRQEDGSPKDGTPPKDEINPDVLGYIFEKYVNQRQMGAYYTKEDITEHIGKNTILPFLLDRARAECQVAFEGEHGLWRLLRENPDRYIYRAVKYGTETKDHLENPLPEAVKSGIDDVGARGEWNKPAPTEFGQATETWRDVVVRRQQYVALRTKLIAGEMREVADLVTNNLNIRQFTQDCIEQGGTDFLRAIWDVLNGVGERLPISILDPTCGSGAFLFAALEILEPIYEACLDRMVSFVADADLLKRNQEHPQFRSILKAVDEHTNRPYFVFKRIIVNNLFGVDIMEEATEICKLRLFLKLAAQVEADPKKENFGIEPLPDIDFNIRAGNTLVGFATEEHARRLTTGALQMEMTWEEISRKAKIVDNLFKQYRQMQTESDVQSGFAAMQKKALLSGLDELRGKLDRSLGYLYGRIGNEDISAWRKQVQPFHWMIEFFGVIRDGGFDVIIGNPPYVEYKKKDAKTGKSISDQYKIKGYDTEGCGNLYGFTIEQSFHLLRLNGRMGMIVPLSLTFSRDFVTLRRILLQAAGHLQVSNYDNIPDRLFTGAKESENTSKANQQRITIFIVHNTRMKRQVQMTPTLRWKASERKRLFSSLPLVDVTAMCSETAFPKLGSSKMKEFLRRWQEAPRRLSMLLNGKGQYPLTVPKTAGYYVAAFPDEMERTQQMTLTFGTEDDRSLAMVLLNSNAFFWLWRVYGDSFHVTSTWTGLCPVFKPQDEEYKEIAQQLYAALPKCTVYKGYRGLAVPNVNFNKRMDLLWRADEWIIRHIAPDLGVTPEDFLWGKSNSFFRLDVPKSANYPKGFDPGVQSDDDTALE